MSALSHPDRDDGRAVGQSAFDAPIGDAAEPGPTPGALTPRPSPRGRGVGGEGGSGRPLVVRLIGASGVGKTRLLERLIPLLRDRGFRVGFVKHHHAGRFALDRPGTDSDRLASAGADAIVLASPEQLVLLTAPEPPDGLDQAVALLAGRVDIALVEGYRRVHGPAVLVPDATGTCPPYNGEVIAAYWPVGRDGPPTAASWAERVVATPDELADLLERRYRELASRSRL